MWLCSDNSESLPSVAWPQAPCRMTDDSCPYSLLISVMVPYALSQSDWQLLSTRFANQRHGSISLSQGDWQFLSIRFANQWNGSVLLVTRWQTIFVHTVCWSVAWFRAPCHKVTDNFCPHGLLISGMVPCFLSQGDRQFLSTRFTYQWHGSMLLVTRWQTIFVHTVCWSAAWFHASCHNVTDSSCPHGPLISGTVPYSWSQCDWAVMSSVSCPQVLSHPRRWSRSCRSSCWPRSSGKLWPRTWPTRHHSSDTHGQCSV